MLETLFDAQFYLENNQDVADAGVDPLQHYLANGFEEGRDPHPLFDTSFYLNQRLDVLDAGAEPFGHYLDVGFEEDTLDGSGDTQSDPNRFFDSAEYLAKNQDVALAAINPLAHYIQFGEQEILDGNRGALSEFDAAFYEANAEQALVDAVENGTFDTYLEHFLRFGNAEGRLPVNNALDLGDAVAEGPTVPLSLKTNPLSSNIRVVDDTNGDGEATISGRQDGTDSLRLTGDASVRIDFTDQFEQLEQIDVDGDGVFEPGTDEFNVRDKVAVQFFEILDAHPRIVFDEDGNVVANALLDPTDIDNGFTGDILFDGTGFAGDGVNTNGNIALGGWGDDSLFGGIGNDFLAGGGSLNDGLDPDLFQPPGNLLSGGRNADFFYLELSTLDQAFAGQTDIKGGSTFDNDPRQDFDWLLLEASDDQEPVVVRLQGVPFPGLPGTGIGGGVGTENPPQPGQPIAGTSAFLEDIENINASGNFYEFLTTFDVAVDTIAIRVAYYDAANDIEAWDRLEEYAFEVVGGSGGDQAVEEFVITRDDVITAVGEDADFDRDDWLAATEELLGEDFAVTADTVDDPTQGIEDAPAIRIEDNLQEDRDFVDGSVEQEFRNEGDAVNTQRVAEPVTVPLADPFVDLYFGDFRDFTALPDVGIIRVPGLSPGVTAQMDVVGSVETNIIVGGYDNDRIDGAGGDDLLFGGDLQFLMQHRHVVNAFSTETGGIILNTREAGPTSIAETDVVADDGSDTLLGGLGNDNLVIELDGGRYDGDGGLDTLWMTDFSAGREVGDGESPNFDLLDAREGNGNTGSESDALGQLVEDGRVRFDLGTGSNTDYQGYGGADLRVDGQFTADQSNYQSGVGRSLVTDIENVNASGLGEVDYLAAGQNDPDLVFANQQNFRGTNAPLDLRGIDTLEAADLAGLGPDDIAPGSGIESDINANNFTAEQLIYAQTDESAVVGWDGVIPKTIDGLNPPFVDRAGSPENVLEDQGPTPSSELTGRDERFEENELVSSSGEDILEGRGGNDRLSGREGDDIFLVSLNAGDARRDDGFTSGQDNFGDNINIISRDLDIFNYQAALETVGLNVGNLPIVAEQTAAQRDAGLVSVRDDNAQPNGPDNLVDRVDPETGRLSNDPDDPVLVGQDFRVPEGDLPIPEFAISASGNLRTDVANSTTEGEPFQFLDVLTIDFVEPINGQGLLSIQLQDDDVEGIEVGTAEELRDAVQEALDELAGEDIYNVVLGGDINEGVNDNDEPLNDENAISIEVSQDVENAGQFAIGSIDFQDSVPFQQGFGGYDALSEVQAFGQGDDDELIFVSYNDRLDNELAADLDPVDGVPYNAESLGKEAYAEDLVTRVVDGSTILTEGQEYRVYFEDLAKGDEVTLTVNGVEYTLTVGFTVNGVEVDGQSVEAFVAQLATLVNATTAIDPHTAAGELDASWFAIGDAAGAEVTNNAVLVLQQQDTNASGAEQVFMEFPTVQIVSQETGGQTDEAIAIVKETSDTSTVLYAYDGSPDAAGLNTGYDAEDDRADGRFITFEGQDGLGPDGIPNTADDGDNRAILQTADPESGDTLEGLEAYQEDDEGNDRVAIENLPESPGNGGNQIGEPSVATWAALHGDDLLIGSDADDEIDGKTGDDRIVGSRGEDEVDGGLDLVVDGDGVVVNQVNARELALPTADDADQPETGETPPLSFIDSLVFEERDFLADPEDDPSFTVSVSSITDPGSGQVLVDEDGDGDTDHTTDFTNIEVVRTFSGAGPLGNGNSPTPNDVLDVSAASAATDFDFSDDDDDTFGIIVDFDAGTHNVRLGILEASDPLLLQVEGVETIIGGAGFDVLDGTLDDNLIQGGGEDDSLFGLAGDDTLQGGDGDDTLVGGAGSDDLQGGAGNNIYRYEADAFEVEGIDSITGDFDGGGDDGDFDRIDLQPLLVENGGPVVNGLEFVDVDADGNPPEAPNQVRVVSGENSSTVTVIGDTLDDQFSFTANAALDEADFLDIGASQAPDAEDDTGAVDEDATVAIPVLDNDSDPQGDAFGTVSIDGQAVVFGDTVTLASGAEATLNANGTITYDPTTAGFPDLALDEEFPDSFTYTIEDVAGNSDAGSTADVDVTVTGIEEGAEVTIDVNAAATFNATAEADIFTISVDDDGVDGGDIFGPGFDGTAIIDGFDPAQDILRFVNEAGSTVSEDDLLNEVGIEVAEDPFTPAVTYFFNLDPDGDEATVEIPGIGAQNADFIEVA